MKYRSLEQGSMNDSPMISREPYYPKITLSEKQCPMMKDKEVGDKCEMMIRAKVSGMSQHANGPKEYTLDMMQIGMHNEEEA